MKTITNLLARLGVLALGVILCNCSSVPNAATNAVLGGAGAYIGHEITDGEPEGTLLGSMAGVATGALFNHARERGQEKAYGNGYDKGRGDLEPLKNSERRYSALLMSRDDRRFADPLSVGLRCWGSAPGPGACGAPVLLLRKLTVEVRFSHRNR